MNNVVDHNRNGKILPTVEENCIERRQQHNEEKKSKSLNSVSRKRMRTEAFIIIIRFSSNNDD